GWSGRLKPRPPRRTLAEDRGLRNGAQSRVPLQGLFSGAGYFGAGCLSQPRRRGEGVAPPQRRHSMATNSSRAEVSLVVGTAPAISSRSILRNDAASA